MVYAIYIAAAAVIGLLIGFVALSILWLQKTVLHNIRSKTIGLLSVYDELLEEKSRQLLEMEALELAQQKKAEESQPKIVVPAAKEGAAVNSTAMLDMAEKAGLADYRDGKVSELYRLIRKSFSFRVEDLAEELKDPANMRKGPAGRLLEELEWETVYSLSTLPSEEQISVLREVLDVESLELLETYRSGRGRFSVLEFYDALGALADREPKPVKLWVSPEYGELALEGVDVIPDREICEGFQVEAEHLLYDYCIKARELR